MCWGRVWRIRVFAKPSTVRELKLTQTCNVSFISEVGQVMVALAPTLNFSLTSAARDQFLRFAASSVLTSISRVRMGFQATNSILKRCYYQHARYLSTHDFNKKSRLWNCPIHAKQHTNEALRPSCLVRSRFPYCRYYPANCHFLLYIHLRPSHHKPTLQQYIAPRNANDRSPPILCLFPHLIFTIDGRNKSIRFVSDQGDDHRIEIKEEHYEVEA